MMRLFANLFLLLFIADGGISFVDELASLVAPQPGLGELRNAVAFLVAFLAGTMFSCLGIDKRLPKRVFTPLIAFVFLYPISRWLFPALASPAAGLLAAAGQIALCLYVTRDLRKDGERTLLPKEIFSGPSFSLKNTLTFAAINLVVAPVVLALMLLVTADAYMQQYTSGFMRLGPDGLHMAEKVYRRQGKTIRLAGMIHMGEGDYYDSVLGTVAPGRTIVLAEGVSDQRNMLQDRPDYGKLAGYLGLASQQDKLRFRGRAIQASELDGPAGPDQGSKSAGPDILRADVDISSFTPTTVWFLNALGKQMKESPTLSKQLLSSVAWSEKNVTVETQKVIMDDILNRRNQVLLGHMRKALPRYDTVVVPWGALHMADIEREVIREGFTLQEVRDRVSIRFSKKAARPDAAKENLPP